MGQYYVHANIDRQELYSPDGIKLMEHSWVGGRSTQRLYELLRTDWKGDRVVVVGDYFEAKENKSIGLDLSKRIYEMDWKEPKIKNPDENAMDVKKWEAEQQIGFYVNYDKQEAIDLSNLPTEKPEYAKHWDGLWITSPLTLMVACGNGRGGGDFYEGSKGYEFVGTWAGDHVGIEDELPEKYKVITPDFKEK